MHHFTPAEIKAQHQQLKQQELQQFAQTDINQLILHRTLFCDQLLIGLWQQFGLDQTDLSLIAVGGYGRQEMFPLSDLDFLILSEQANSAEIEQKIAAFVQFLWDCGFEVGASVRSLAQCDSEGRAEISIATNLLEGRLLCGNTKLFQKLTALLRQADFWDRETFFNAKIEEKNQRYQRYNNTSYNLEPDIKYSPGGLRDLHLIYWIALRHNNAMNLAQILDSGLINQEEYALLLHSQRFLFRVRFALHLMLKRYDNRLLFDRQLKVAQLLGYQGEGNQGVELLMKHFFQALNRISSLSDILAKHYRENVLQSAVYFQPIFLDQDFALQGDEIVLNNAHCFRDQSDKILDLFYYLTQYPQAEIHSATLRQLQLALAGLQHSLSELPLAREKFLRLFSQPNAIQRAFVPMHKYGVLSAYLPQWKGIEGLMQFDLFHVYTVDEHSLRVMLKLESFLQPEAAQSHPICHRIFSQFFDRTLLYLAALFHDIAKGQGGDHAQLGARQMREFAYQHGFGKREAETMAWLVEQHLLMSIVAQRRDIHDPNVVKEFALQVQNKVRLDLLTCLTVADICATNQTLWNSWKRSLFTTLYQYSLQQFDQGTDRLLDNQQKIQAQRQQALAQLQQQNAQISAEEIQLLWANFPADYFLRNNIAQLCWHTQLLLSEAPQPLVKVSNRFANGGTEVFVYCRDQANLFYKLVSAIGAKKLSIHDAQIFTTADGYAIDSFIVTESSGNLLEFERRRALEQSLNRALRLDKIRKIAQPENPKLAHFQIKTEVRFLNVNKKQQTEFELFTLDKQGLLAEISQIFTELGLSLVSAKITTVGARAEDFFILVNQQNQALSESQRAALEQLLRTRLS